MTDDLSHRAYKKYIAIDEALRKEQRRKTKYPMMRHYYECNQGHRWGCWWAREINWHYRQDCCPVCMMDKELPATERMTPFKPLTKKELRVRDSNVVAFQSRIHDRAKNTD